MTNTTDSVQIVSPAESLIGTAILPADKSVAHRAALFSSIADGTSRIVGYPASADPQSTLACLRQLGVEMSSTDEALVIHGKGLYGLSAPASSLDCANSGTTMRLLSGILAGQRFDSTLMGDESLSARPMDRIINPLSQMGAFISSSGGCAPLQVRGTPGNLRSVEYELPVASAQVKSCVLLAGLYADSVTTIIESQKSRDHTERMLGLSSVLLNGKRSISVEGGMSIEPRLWSIPADFSAASFFIVAATIQAGSIVKMARVGLNPSRTGLLDVLRAMGADIEIKNERKLGGEPIGDVTVRSRDLHGVSIEGDIVSNLIDEIPILCVAATRAEGRTEIRGARELRFKESDRIKAMVTALRNMGALVEEFKDGLAIEGGQRLRGADVHTLGDHRIAMALAVAALTASEPVRIHGADIANVSFPGFFTALDALRAEG